MGIVGIATVETAATDECHGNGTITSTYLICGYWWYWRKTMQSRRLVDLKEL